MSDKLLLKYYAEYFHEMGFNISYLSNITTEYNFIFGPKKLKAPSYEWEIFYDRRQSSEELNSYNWDEALGIGLILGYNNLAAIDIDGCVDQDLLYDILYFLNLPKDYKWVIKSGSNAGFHIIFKTTLHESHVDPQKPKFTDYQKLDKHFGKKEVNAYYPRTYFNFNYENLKYNRNAFCKIEFKWRRHIIIPPSLHASSRKYKFLHDIPNNPPEWIDFEKVSEFQYAISGNAACDSMHEGFSVDDANSKLQESNRVMVLDVETNGLVLNNSKDFNETDNWPRLLQISWGICLNEQYLVEEFSYLHLVKREIRNITVKDFNINPNAERINGLDELFLSKMGEDLKVVLLELIVEMNKCDFIVCHNVQFDIGVLMSEMKRCGLSEFNIFKEKKLYCTMELNKDLCKIGSEPFKYPSLSELYKYCFNKNLIPDHNSIHDMLITIQCYNESQWRWGEIDPDSIPKPNYIIENNN